MDHRGPLCEAPGDAAPPPMVNAPLMVAAMLLPPRGDTFAPRSCQDLYWSFTFTMLVRLAPARKELTRFVLTTQVWPSAMP